MRPFVPPDHIDDNHIDDNHIDDNHIDDNHIDDNHIDDNHDDGAARLDEHEHQPAIDVSIGSTDLLPADLLPAPAVVGLAANTRRQLGRRLPAP